MTLTWSRHREGGLKAKGDKINYRIRLTDGEPPYALDLDDYNHAKGDNVQAMKDCAAIIEAKETPNF